MSRSAIIVMVCMAAYCLLDLAVSACVVLVWKTRAVAPANLPPAVRAQRVLVLRLAPVTAALTITLLVVFPAFALFEPIHDNEPVGPVLAALTLLALAHFGGSVIRGSYSLWLTRRVEREWLASSTTLASTSDMRAFIVDAASPIVALVGVFAPRLIAARRVIEACTDEELAAIIAHERGHFDARDNFKRWLMASLPDSLRWTRIHREMTDAWHHAAEDAADDAATNGDPEARADLAALLLKVVRIAPHPMWKAAVVSPFVERDGLERRVRRLIKPELEPPAPLAVIPMIAVGLIGVTMIATLSSIETMEAIFLTFENLVSIGR